MSYKIKAIQAREILDSRNKPTVEVELETDNGLFLSSVPSGTSTGSHEAVEIPAAEAVENINQKIAPALAGKDVARQQDIDHLLIDLDDTKNKSRLGANAVLPVSMAVARAGAATGGIPLYKYIAKLAENCSLPVLPKPCILCIEGGLHGKSGLEVQEFMIIPQEKSFSDNLKAGQAIYNRLKEILKKKFGNQAVKLGLEAGFTPPLTKTEEALDLILEAAKTAGYENIGIALDCAAAAATKDSYRELIKNYPILILEDPFSEQDWESFSVLTKEIGERVHIIGDDLTTTNPERIKIAKDKQACNGIVVKPNQIGTVTETIEAVNLAKQFGWKTIVSHRSGETKDDFIADLSVGINADFIKAGGPATEFRMAKYNRLLKIENEITN